MKLQTFFFMLFAFLPFSMGLVQAQEKVMMLVGTYTDGSSRGIYSYSFNQETGEATALNALTTRNPSFLTVSPDRRRVYAVCETNDDEASLKTIRLNPRTGEMELIGSAAVQGGDPCYVATNGQTVLTANYSGGSMSVFRLKGQASLPDLVTRFLGSVGGPDLTRQETPHVHCACFTPDGKYALATDFSADRILSFRLDGQKVAANGVAATVSADSGPRHLIFSRDGRYAYLMSELSGRVTVFRYAQGRLEQLQEIVSDSVAARGGADLHLSPDGRFLYSSNRLQAEGIAIFAVNAQTGLLTRVGYQPTAAHPRQFNISPNGRYLLCCCRDSDKIQVFLRNPKTGLLTDTHKDIPLSKPVCVQMF
ncbi:MAG: lactonase family protein [Bacteroidaceae bacterium]|nr:lactonase family protein [Bacteroidaceae bacterium]